MRPSRGRSTTRSSSKTRRRSNTTSKGSTSRGRSGTPGRRSKKASAPRNLKARSIVAGPEVRKSLAGFVNPFSSTHGARIPDGSVTHSLGSHHRNVADVSYKIDPDGGGANWDTIEIIVYPGLHGGAVYRPVNIGNTGNNAFGSLRYIDYNNSDCNLGGIISYDIENERCNSTLSFLEIDGGLSRWRAVSQALRLTLINSDEKNDGWWEACRYAYSPKMPEWEVGFTTEDRGNTVANTAGNGGNYSFKNASYRPTEKMFQYFHKSDDSQTTHDWKNIAEQKSYAVGALKHIHNNQFNLCHIARDEEFKQCYKTHALDTNDHEAKEIGTAPDNDHVKLVLGEEANTYSADTGSAPGKRIHDAFVDENLDFIYVRIHMGMGSSRMLLEHAANHEIVYENDSPLAKFMLPGAKHPATNAAKAARAAKSSSPASSNL